MNPQRPEHEIDALVGAYLRRQAEGVDPTDMLRRVRLGQVSARPPRRWRRALLGLATAARTGAAAAWACIRRRAIGNSVAAFLAPMAPNLPISAAICSGCPITS